MSDVLDDVLKEAGSDPAPFYLFWGEEFLVRQGAEALIQKLLPSPEPGLNFITLDGTAPREVADELATLPLFPGRKVVLVRDPEFLAPKKGRGDALAKGKDSWRAGRRKEGARRVLAIAARAGWGPKELESPDTAAWEDELGIELAEADLVFLKEVAAFCLQEGLSAPDGDVGALTGLLKKGLFPGQVLVIAATEVDAKSALVKLARELGKVIERKVEGRLDKLDISRQAADALRPYGKKLSLEAQELLKNRCGNNMRLLQSELEKLALYVEGKTIEGRDVELLVAHAREGEFLELSDALQKRDLPAALRFLDEALGQSHHPIQLLGIIASVTRTLIDGRDRLAKLVKGPFRMSYREFQERVLPQIEKEAKERKQRLGHPYGTYMGMQAASRFTDPQLLGTLLACADADVALKSSANGRLTIERLVFRLCA